MCLRTLLVLEGVQTDLDRVRALRARAPPLFLLLRTPSGHFPAATVKKTSE
jgi:hypothetical protein